MALKQTGRCLFVFAALLVLTATTQSCSAANNRQGISGLPHAQGALFYSLDEYLSYLEKRSVMDVSYYKEIEPGIYELQVMFRHPGEVPSRKSRAELMQEFGFTK